MKNRRDFKPLCTGIKISSLGLINAKQASCKAAEAPEALPAPVELGSEALSEVEAKQILAEAGVPFPARPQVGFPGRPRTGEEPVDRPGTEEFDQSRRNPRIVIMANRDKVEMEGEIADKVGDLKNTRIICRSGDPTDLYDLSIVNPRELEAQINNIVGVVTNGLFAARPADLLLLGTSEGVKSLTAK